MVKLLGFIDINGNCIELYAEPTEFNTLRMILSKEKMNSFVALISKKELEILIDDLNKLQSQIPESPESIIENLLLAGKTMSDLDTQTLLNLYRAEKATSIIFSWVVNEIRRRIEGV